MNADPASTALVAVLLLMGNAFFVAAEYGLVGARRARIEAMAKRGHANAKRLMLALDNMSSYVAGIQIAITVFGIAMGALVEEPISAAIGGWLVWAPEWAVRAVSILLVAYPLVVAGELVPKYLTLKYSDQVALVTIPLLSATVVVLKPLVWLFRQSGSLALRPLGMSAEETGSQKISREELALLVRSAHVDSGMDEMHADVLNRTLRLDKLDAADIMVHRLDMDWLDADLPLDSLKTRLKETRHSRLPVCQGDIDEVVGVAYLQDIVRHWDAPDFSLRKLMRQAEFVPESLTLDRILTRMRESKTQMLIVRDEYGGTSGLLTLEDVSEEVFGDLEDHIESERAPIERTGTLRITARADVRYDELLAYLKHEADNPGTETLATLLVQGLGRVPRLGDTVPLPIGTLRVENMARRRVTRVSVNLSPETFLR